MLDFETSKTNSEVSKSNSNIILVQNYFFYVTSGWAITLNVLYYQQLSIARYQVHFYAYNYFECPHVFNIDPLLSLLYLHRVVVNYLVWRLVNDLVSDLGQTFIDIRQKYINVIRGTSASSARWQRCVNEDNSLLEFATGRLYVEENFPANAKEKVMF